MEKTTDVTFYKNCCPFCESEDLLMISGDSVEEPSLFCNKCKKSFPVNSAKKKQVGDTSNV